MIDKKRMKDEKGRYIVQGLFLETRYDTEWAQFTLDGEDKDYKGKVYPSLKRLYLQYSDPKEYNFANEYLVDYPHWQRITHNKTLREHVDQWRAELELKLISDGVSVLIDLATEKDSYQAAKWMADRGWDKSVKGRPSKEQVKGELKKRADEAEEFAEDFQLLKLHKES